MARANYDNGQRNRRKNRSVGAPFGIQVPSSLRDPTDADFSEKQLESLRNDDQAREFALGYIHDHDIFAKSWNSTRLHPNTRRVMRKVVQIQTINAVCNGYTRKNN